MAVTQTQYTGNGNTVLYSFTFPYLATTDVKVKINGVTQPTTAYSLANATTVQMNSAPANGATVLIFRDTDNDNKKATFYPGSAIKAEDLNDNIDQILYVAQEVDNNAMSTLGDDAMQGDLSLGNNKITNLGNPVNGTDGVNKTTLDSTIDTAIESDVLVGTDLSKSASGGQVTISHNVSGANTTINNSGGNVVQDITISAQGHVTSAGSVNLDNRYYTETELDAGQLDNRYFTETELSGGQLNNLYYTETELDGGQLDNRYFTETELNNGALDTRYFTEAELNNGQLDTRYFRQDSSETITSGATWSGSDNFIATTAAIDARIVDLVDDVGGFVPIANETSFPATNPDVNNGTGTLVSIKSISSARTPSGGSVVITDGAGSGNDVTITGLGTTVLPAGYGVIVETTGTTHTYTFHRLSPDATSVTAVSAIPNEIATVAGISSHVQTVSGINNDVQVVSANNSNVTTVAGSITSVNTAANNLDQIQNFANVYRIVNSDPTTSLNAGDLIFNTTTNKFRVYTGAAWVDAVARQFSDNTKMQFGDGNDLEIFHDGNHSRIKDVGTGDLVLHSNTISLVNAADSETLAQFKQNGSVDLYYDGVKKFETNSAGTYTTGNVSLSEHIHLADSKILYAGAGNDLQIYHDGTNSYLDNNTGDFFIRNNLNAIKIRPKNDEESIVAHENGAVELHYDGSKKFETTSTGIETHGNITTHDLLPDANAFRNIGLSTNKWNALHATTLNTGALNTSAASTFNEDVTFTGVTSGANVVFDKSHNCLKFADNVYAKFGTGEDLQIYHDGTSSYILDNGAGHLNIKTNGTQIILTKTPHENLAVFNVDGNNELYYDGTKKLETTANGITMSGHIDLPDQKEVRIGGASLRLRHDGHSIIQNDETGACMFITSHETQFANTGLSEAQAKFFQDGAVELYYDGSKKFETNSSGTYTTGNVSLSGHIHLADNGVLYAGTGNDLQIYHDGTHSHITNATNDLNISCATSDADLILKAKKVSLKDLNNSFLLRGETDGEVKLYYDGSKKFETKLNGVTVQDLTASGAYLDIKGSDGVNGKVYGVSGTTIGFLDNQNHYLLKGVKDGAVSLYFDNSPKLETTSAGIDVTGRVTTDDLTVENTGGNLSAMFTATNGLGTLEVGGSTGAFIDLKHPATDDYDLRLGANGNNGYINTVNNFTLTNNGKNSLYAAADAGTKLYFDGNEKLETTSTGVEITGGLDCSTTGQVVAKFEGTGASDPQIYVGDDMSSPVNNAIILGYDKADNRGYLTIAGDADNTLSISDGNLVGINTSTNVEHFNVQGNIRLINPTGTTRRINALPSGSYNVGTSGGSAIAFHRFSDAGGGSDEIAFETHYQGNRHGESARISKFGGITFNGDTAADNALDDYEEGTWTPDIRYSDNLNTANQCSYGSRSGQYTKIGRVVNIHGFVNLSSINSNTGNVYLYGLPFAPVSGSQPILHFVGDGFDFGSNEFGTTFFLVEGGNNRASAGWQRPTGWSHINNNQFSSSGGMYITGFYYV